MAVLAQEGQRRTDHYRIIHTHRTRSETAVEMIRFYKEVTLR